MATPPSRAGPVQAATKQQTRQPGEAGSRAPLDRRRFVQRMGLATAFGAATVAAGGMRGGSDVEAAIVASDDPRLATSRTSYPGATGEVGCYLAMPADSTGPLPAIGVFHEDCGLVERIEDVTRRIALAGFVAIAPDFLSRQGGTPASKATARRLIGEPHATPTIGDAVAAIRFLEAHPTTTGKVGVTGFCWGGDLTHRAAVAVPELDAAVAWHANPPPVEYAASVQAALMMHHAERDPRIETAVAAYAAALDAAGVAHTLFVYEGVEMAFEDDTNQARYDPAAAALAWQRTIDFLQVKLAA